VLTGEVPNASSMEKWEPVDEPRIISGAELEVNTLSKSRNKIPVQDEDQEEPEFEEESDDYP